MDKFKSANSAIQKFILFLFVYFTIWSIAPAFLASSVALDVSEGINWGSEWQWGYYKHPPFSSWVLYSFYKVFGHFGPYILSQIYVLLTLFLVYKLANKVLCNSQAWLGTLLTLAIFYYTYPTLEFNHNVAQFPIWAGLSLLFYNSITENKYRDWILLGIVGGIGMLTKYSVAFLLIPMALYLLAPQQWRLLKQPKPWISAAIMLIIFAPHLNWLIQNNWLPFEYAKGRSSETIDSNVITAHFGWVNFLLAQLVVHLPLLIILLLSRKSLSFKVNIDSPRIKAEHSISDSSTRLRNLKLIGYIWLSPVIFLIILNLVFGMGLRDLWGMPMWALSGLLAASLIKPESLTLLESKLPKYLTIWLSLITILMMIYLQFGHTIRNKPSRMDWPEQELSLKAQATWDELSSCKWDSLSGDRWLIALIAMNAEKSELSTTESWPSLMINGPASHSPWITKTRLEKHGTLVVSLAEDKYSELPLLNQISKDSLTQYSGQWEINWPKLQTSEPLIIKWEAYVPHQCVKQNQDL